MDNITYFKKLLGTVTRIARHSYYPGKGEAVELCLEEIEELHDCGRINDEQLASLRELLVGEETFCVLDGEHRDREHSEQAPSPHRIALVCQGTGSQAAFTAGVLQGLLGQLGSSDQIVALGGTSFGAVCALLAWDGLLRGEPRAAIDQIEEFWGEYAAASLIDALLNYSSQMVLYLRAMVPLPILGLHEVSALGPDQFRGMLEHGSILPRHVRWQRGRAPLGLVIGIADAFGIFEVCPGSEVTVETMQTASGVLLHGPAAISRSSPPGRAPCPSRLADPRAHQLPTQRDLADRSQEAAASKAVFPRRPGARPDRTRQLPGARAGTLFIEKINSLLRRGALIDSGYRPIEVHRIVMEHDLDDHSKLDRGPGFIRALMSYGRERATQFLEKRAQRLASRAGACV